MNADTGPLLIAVGVVLVLVGHGDAGGVQTSSSCGLLLDSLQAGTGAIPPPDF